MQIIKLHEAREDGLRRYFTGKPCVRGHIAERMVSTRTCVQCKNDREKDRADRVLNEEQRLRRNKLARERRKTTPQRNMTARIRSLINIAISKHGFSKTSATREILGCDYEEFVRHIERQFVKGMTWKNRNEWHIDHIIPVSSAQTVDDVIRLNHFTNLRPLWSHENRKKSATRSNLL